MAKVQGDAALRAKTALAFAVVYLVWGSTYLAIGIGLRSMPPFTMAGSRFLIAGLALWLWCELRGEARPTRTEARNAALAGLCLLVLGNGFVTLAERTVPSGLTALIVALGPAFTVLLGWARGDRGRPNLPTVAGLGLGLAGVGLLVAGSGGGSVDPLGVGMILIANAGWSWGVLHTQASPMPASALRATATQMLVGGTAMLLIGLASGEVARVRLDRIDAGSWGAFAYLVVFGAIGAYTAYNWLLGHVSAAAAGTTAYVNPLVAVLLGALWGEKVGPFAFVALALILAGVGLLKREKPPQTVEARWAEEAA